jgi:lipid-A-disaccharide synthase
MTVRRSCPGTNTKKQTQFPTTPVPALPTSKLRKTNPISPTPGTRRTENPVINIEKAYLFIKSVFAERRIMLYNPAPVILTECFLAEENGKKRIFISACEPSADNHCAGLIESLNELNRQQELFKDGIEWVGVGGEKMAGAECDILQETTSKAAMLYNAIGQIRFYSRLLKRISTYFENNKVDLVIVCDSPAFNFHVARIAKKHGVKVLFYVAPQLWAWAAWRIWKLRMWCDKLACILPFEEDWFTTRGVDATFVGNPLFDDIPGDFDENKRNYADFDPWAARIALFPGSRNAEIKKLWPAMQKIAMSMQDSWPRTQFVVTAANQEKLQMLMDKEIRGFNCKYTMGDTVTAAMNVDMALVASGSATLEVAAAGCPMIIMYQSSRFLWHILGRWLVKTRFLSLVNILAGREIVPEFMPYFTSLKPIEKTCNSLISSKLRLIKASSELVSLVKPLAQDYASDKVAAMAVEMMTEE